MTASTLTRQFSAALRLLLVLTVLLGAAYPAAIWAAGRVGLPDQAQGSLVRSDGRVVGSRLLGQAFPGPQWFHGRPSASDYAGDTSGGSNLPATDARLRAAVDQRAAQAGPGAPADALTASGSGLDPHITPENAAQQVDRVARARHLDPAVVRDLVTRHTQGRTLGFLGEPRVNVLELNLALRSVAAR